MAGRGFGPALGMLVLLSTAASGRPGEPEARAPIALEMPANAPAACAPVAPIPLVNPAVLGDGTPGSVTTAAIQAALDAGGHIRFDVGAGPVTIDVTSELTVSRAAVLDGGGNVTLSGRGLNRVIRVLNAPSAAQTYPFGLQNITIADGATPAESGAGMLTGLSGDWQAVDLRIVNVTFLNNTAITTAQDDGGGAIYAVGARELLIAGSVFEGNRGSNGGAVYSLGSKTVTILGSRFSDNAATGMGGNPGSGGNGGAIGVDGAQRTVTLCGTRILANHSNAYGTGFFSVGYDTLSPTTFYRTTFQGNVQTSSAEFAAGAYVQGVPFAITESSFLENEANGYAGLFLGPDATGTIENSTFHGNVARQGLGGALAVGTEAPVTIVNTSIVANTATAAFIGGIQVGTTNQLTLRNVVLAFNTGGNVWNPWNISRTVAGSNVIQYPQFRPPPSNQAEPPAVTTSLQWADPLILAPAWNGGPTKTMALTAASPARDAGTATGAPSIDQRGVLRDGAPDLGAYELSTDVIFADGFEP
jgi:predicted outer membrane repeat protein